MIPEVPSGPDHMTPDEFRAAGHATVDWIADFLAGVADRPIMPDVAPGDVRASLPPSPPQAGESSHAPLADVADRRTTRPNSRPKPMPAAVPPRRVHGFVTGFGVGLVQNQLQNNILHQNYEKS